MSRKQEESEDESPWSLGKVFLCAVVIEEDFTKGDLALAALKHVLLTGSYNTSAAAVINFLLNNWTITAGTAAYVSRDYARAKVRAWLARRTDR